MDSSLKRYLAGYVIRRRIVFALRAVAIAVIAAICWTALWCSLDRAFSLSSGIRVAALIVIGLAMIMIIARPISFLWRKYDPVAIAIEIESRQPVFDQRLITIGSQSQPPSIMLDRLHADVQSIIDQGKIRPAASLMPMLFPMLGAAVCTLIAGIIFHSSTLNSRQLLQRFVKPLATLPPVTTTHLQVQPGSMSIVEGQPLKITVAVEPLDRTDTELHLSNDGQTWTQVTMPTFSTSIPALEHDLRYFVTAGDAISPTYDVRVLRPPGIVEYRIHCDPPADLHRPAFDIVNTDGNFIAPIGSQLIIGIVSTEQLARGYLSMGHDQLDLTPTRNPMIRKAKLTLEGDIHYQVHLTAENGITASSKSDFIQAMKPGDVSQRPEVPGYDEQLKLYFESLDRVSATQPLR